MTHTKMTSPRATAPARADLSVLVVDDDPDIRTVIREVLEGEGYSVATAADGAAALEILRTRVPRLILLDLTMPTMDGAEFRQVQMKDLDMAAIPTVVMTARPDPRTQVGPLLVRGCLAKPIALRDLLRIVVHYCA